MSTDTMDGRPLQGEVVDAPPVGDVKVSKGWQTYVGYGAAAVSAACAAVLVALEEGEQDPLKIALVAAAALLVAITNRNRSEQARTLVAANARVIEAQAFAAQPTLTVGGGPANVELTDAMPSDPHLPHAEG